MPEYNTRLDVDTKVKGVEGPFEDYEADHTGLVHVLWAARNEGLTLERDADEIASMIMRSRWLAANKSLSGEAGEATECAAVSQ